MINSLLLAALILTGCSPCQTFLDADRKLNATLFNGNPHKTITTEQFAEKDSLVCGALNLLILPYDLFCADEILNHCDYWRRMDNQLVAANEPIRNQSPVEQTIEPCNPPEIGCTVIISKYKDGSVTRRIARCDKQGECKVEAE